MRISVLDPISPAIDRTKLILFQPFDLKKWLALGFCSFLASLGEGGGGPSGTGNVGDGGGGGGGDGGGGEMDQAWQWIQENLPIILSVAAGVLVVGCLFGLLIVWLSSRGKFMLLDGIVHNRGAIAEPWREYRREAFSLFLFRIVFGFGCLGAFLLIVGLSVLIAMPSIQAGEFNSSAGIALAVGISLVILFTFVVVFVGVCLEHFVVPIMYLRRAPVMAAWREFRHQILAGHVGTMILYFLVQLLIGMVLATIAFIVTCLTCCIAALPYVGSVILLPLPVFLRSYTLYFLEQFGPKWRFFPDGPEGKPPTGFAAEASGGY